VIVFLDTNVLVSAIATRGICADLLNVVLADHTLAVGETVLAELREVLRRKLRLPAALAAEAENFLRLHARVVVATELPDIAIRDPGDRFVLAEAVAAGVDVLVTGDHDLLDVAGRATIRILSPRGFWELLRTGQ
jgi:putative PIN family toxin of toxin-antitoxin system